MGGGSYSVKSRSLRASVENSAGISYSNITRDSLDEVFEQNKKKQVYNLMDPKTIKIREARDSAEHPNSVPIIIALDLTGSMRDVPIALVRDGLPHIMSNIIQHGIPDPQLLFLGVGDHETDRAPLQVGQFESSDEKLDQWLTKTYIEAGGGSNAGESYLLAHYFAGYHTVTDRYQKRKQKGFLFTIGDEPGLTRISQNRLRDLMSNADGQTGFSDAEVLKKAQEQYHVYHLHITETGRRLPDYWAQLLGENCIVIDDHKDVARVITDIVTKNVVTAVKTEDIIMSKEKEETKITL
jgi:hypothetical protein